MSLISSFKWSFVDKFLTFFVQILGNILLARILSPNDFGIVAIPMIIYSLGLILSEAGISNYIISTKELDSKLVSNLHWFVIFVAIFFGVISYFFAKFLLVFFFDEIYFNELLCYSVLVVFQSASSVPIALMVRKFRFKEISIIRISSVSLALILTLVLSIFLKNHFLIIIYFSLIILLRLLFINFFTKFPTFIFPKFQFIKDAINYSLPILGAALISDFYKHMQTLIIARSVDLKKLGDWSQARNLNDSFNGLSLSIASQVLLPYFSLKKRELASKNFIANFFENYRIYFVFVTLFYAFVIVFCNEVVSILLGDKWSEMAITTIKLFAVFGYFVPLNGYLINYFKTNNSTKEIFQSECVKKSLAIVIILSLAYSYGFNGLIIGIGINSISEYIINTIFISKKSKINTISTLRKNLSLLLPNYLFILGFLFLEVYISETFSLIKLILFVVLIFYSIYNLNGKIYFKS